MIVSQFLMQSYSSGPPVLYGLLLTNLASKPYAFRISLRSRHPHLHQRVDCTYWYEGGEGNVPLVWAGPDRYRGANLVYVASHETVRIQLRPSYSYPAESRQLRGYVELSLPEVST